MKDMMGTTINVGDRVVVLYYYIDRVGDVGRVIDTGAEGPEVEFTYDLSEDRPYPKPIRGRITNSRILVLK